MGFKPFVLLLSQVIDIHLLGTPYGLGFSLPAALIFTNLIVFDNLPFLYRPATSR